MNTKPTAKFNHQGIGDIVLWAAIVAAAALIAITVIGGDGRLTARVFNQTDGLGENTTVGSEPSAPEYATDHLIVKFKADKTAAFNNQMAPAPTATGLSDIDRLNQKYKVDEMKRVFPDKPAKAEGNFDRARTAFSAPDLSSIYILKMETGANIDQAVADYSRDPAVEYAEPDFVVTVDRTPNDPYYASAGSWGQSYGDLWGIHQIGAARAWDVTTGSAGVVVAVIDTGLDSGHADLAGNMWTNAGEIPDNGRDDDSNGYVDDYHGYDFYNYDGNPADDHGHGTHCAGTIAGVGDNSTGVTGVNWTGRVMAVKFLGASGSGWLSDAVSAIQYATDNGAHVLSNSWGGGGYSQTLQAAINYAYANGTVFVAAAGNSNADTRYYQPAGMDNVVTVAATQSDDSRANFSNYGDEVDVAAPGVDVLSLRASGTSMGSAVGTYYTRASGTSMACPHVSGLAALLLAKDPGLTNAEVEQTIESSADDVGSTGFDIYYGYGRINAGAALTGARVDLTAPGEVQGARASAGTTAVSLTWSNPDDADFAGVKINRRKDDYPASLSEGDTVYDGSETGFEDFDVQASTTYFYSIFSYDQSANYSGPVEVAATTPVDVVITPPPVAASLSRQIIAGAGVGGGPQVRTFTNRGKPSSGGFFAFAQSFRGGVRLASGDVDGDGVDEIIVGAGPGGSPHVRIFEKDGTAKSIDYHPFSSWRRGGVDVAAGDIDGDGKDEIAMSVFSEGSSLVKVYRYDEKRTVVGSWQAFGAGQLIGATVAMGDVDKDGQAEVIVGAGPGGGPHVLVFEANGQKKPIQFFAFHPDLHSGIDVAAGDVDGDGKDEIAAVPLEGDEARVKVYRYNNEHTIVGEWRAYPAGVECGANVDMFDLNNDGRAEVLTGPNGDGGPQVRSFQGSGSIAGSVNFFAFPASMRAGVNVAAGNFE